MIRLMTVRKLMPLMLRLAANDSERVDVTHRIPSALTAIAAKSASALFF
jgi:hypothetical protein